MNSVLLQLRATTFTVFVVVATIGWSFFFFSVLLQQLLLTSVVRLVHVNVRLSLLTRQQARIFTPHHYG